MGTLRIEFGAAVLCSLQKKKYFDESLTIFEILVHLRRQRLEALGGRQERGAGEGSGPRPVHEALRDGHPKASSRRAQLHPLLVRQGGQEAQRRRVRARQHPLLDARNSS